MQLKNDTNGRNLLREVVTGYYEKLGNRTVSCFLRANNPEWNWYYEHYLIDHKHVIRYGLGEDRHLLIGGVELAIGPHYFAPVDFWDYPNSQRFKIEASTEAVEYNLKLLDEFLGY